MEYRAFNNDGELRFIAKGNLKIEKAGDLRVLVISDIRAGRDADNLEPTDDDRTSAYAVREGKLYLASGFDKARDNERPRVEEFTREEGGARSSADNPANDKLLGKWKMEMQLGEQNMDYNLRFEKTGDAVRPHLQRAFLRTYPERWNRAPAGTCFRLSWTRRSPSLRA